jgi:hypothetical protein
MATKTIYRYKWQGFDADGVPSHSGEDYRLSRDRRVGDLDVSVSRAGPWTATWLDAVWVLEFEDGLVRVLAGENPLFRIGGSKNPFSLEQILKIVVLGEPRTKIVSHRLLGEPEVVRLAKEKYHESAARERGLADGGDHGGRLDAPGGRGPVPVAGRRRPGPQMGRR